MIGVSSTMMFMNLRTLARDLRSRRTDVWRCTMLPSGKMVMEIVSDVEMI
jgi:hypothetical protein